MDRKSYSVFYADGNRVVQGDWIKVISQSKYSDYQGMVTDCKNGKVKIELQRNGKIIPFSTKPENVVLVKRKYFDSLQPQLNISDFWGVKKGKLGMGDNKFRLFNHSYDSYSDTVSEELVGVYPNFDDAHEEARSFGGWTIYERDVSGNRIRVVGFKLSTGPEVLRKSRWHPDY